MSGELGSLPNESVLISTCVFPTPLPPFSPHCAQIIISHIAESLPMGNTVPSSKNSQISSTWTLPPVFGGRTTANLKLTLPKDVRHVPSTF